MRRLVVAVVAVLLLLGIGVGADRAVAAAAQRAITDRVEQAVPGAASVTTAVEGFPVLTQVARGSLDHVAVTLEGVPLPAGPTLDRAVVDLYGVSTSSPRTAQRVVARATVPTAALQSLVGGAWRVAPEGTALVVTSTSGLPVTARVTPTLSDGRVGVRLESVTVLGVEVPASSVPPVVTQRVEALGRSLGRLPLGLVPTAVTVTSDGVELTATGSDVDLEKA